MKKTKPLWSIMFVLLSAYNTFAQPTGNEPQMADAFRSEGKIFVVIAVLSIIFICLITYLIYIDVKLKRLEKSRKTTTKL